MFSLKGFIKKGLLDAVGKMADYQVIFNSVGWMEKGVLDENDLSEINAKIEEQKAVQQFTEVTEELEEEIVEETEEEIVEELEEEIVEETEEEIVEELEEEIVEETEEEVAAEEVIEEE